MEFGEGASSEFHPLLRCPLLRCPFAQIKVHAYTGHRDANPVTSRTEVSQLGDSPAKNLPSILLLYDIKPVDRARVIPGRGAVHDKAELLRTGGQSCRRGWRNDVNSR